MVRRDVGGGGNAALTDGAGKEPLALGRQHLVGHAHGAGALAKDCHLFKVDTFISSCPTAFVPEVGRVAGGRKTPPI